MRHARIVATAAYRPGITHSLSALAGVVPEKWCAEFESVPGLGAAECGWGMRPLIADRAEAEFICALTGITRVAIADRDCASDMALEVGRRVLGEGPVPDFIIYCHEGIDEDISGSPACRLQSQLAAPAAFPVALGQLQAAAFPFALEMAMAFLLAEPKAKRVLITCADKWVAPLPRIHGRLAALSDGAAAALVEAGEGDGLYPLAFAHCGDQLDDASLRGPVEAVIEHHARTAAATAREALDRAGLTPDQLDLVVSNRMNQSLNDLVDALLGIRPHQRRLAPEGACYSSADSLIVLDALLERNLLALDETALLWSVGVGGACGCCVLRRAGCL